MAYQPDPNAVNAGQNPNTTMNQYPNQQPNTLSSAEASNQPLGMANATSGFDSNNQNIPGGQNPVTQQHQQQQQGMNPNSSAAPGYNTGAGVEGDFQTSQAGNQNQNFQHSTPYDNQGVQGQGLQSQQYDQNQTGSQVPSQHYQTSAGHGGAVGGGEPTAHYSNTGTGAGYTDANTHNTHSSAVSGAGTTSHTATGTGTGTGHGIKGALAGIHGIGEKIRGEFNESVDRAFNDKQGQVKNANVAREGDQERKTGVFSLGTKDREGALPGSDHGKRV